MIFCQTIESLENHLLAFKNQSIAFVPTMGALHAGHLGLIKQAKKIADRVIVSIFVNPTQFSSIEEAQMYPQNLEADIHTLKYAAVDILFHPTSVEIYNHKIHPESLLEKEAIGLPSIFSESEGKNRPGHFEGVYQVLYRFFSIIKPNIVVFGQKDYQQSMLVKYLQKTAFQNIHIEIVPTVREEYGLALSSRNTKLSDEHQKKARVLYQSLQAIKSGLMNGESSAKILIQKAEAVLHQEPLVQKIISIEIRDSGSFIIKNTAQLGDIALISIMYSGVYLIDNLTLGEKK